jgi:hypothetical protein
MKKMKRGENEIFDDHMDDSLSVQLIEWSGQEKNCRGQMDENVKHPAEFGVR